MLQGNLIYAKQQNMGTHSIKQTLLFSMLLFFSIAVYAQGNSDTLTVISKGISNRITIDSTSFSSTVYDSIQPAIQGKIQQSGEANTIEINTGKQSNLEKKSKQNITITQSGKNNSVKINSR
jgi:hypothetical protein